MIPDSVRRAGITTTIPVEILFAAGCAPLDLNNIFVADEHAARLVQRAEESGFPQSACAWIKGLYGTIHAYGIREVVGVVEGDCSDTAALLEILDSEGIEIHPFGFPHSRRRDDLERELRRLADAFEVNRDEAEHQKQRLDKVRRIATEIDACATERGCVTSRELFDSLLLLSDMGGDIEYAEAQLRARLAEYAARPDSSPGLRLGYLGVPTILTDLFETFESCGARFVYHEIPRQFALLDGIGQPLADAYLNYTYPYDMAGRIRDIHAACKSRALDGLVHYVQSFCHRQIHDRLLREQTDLPILTLEADRPGTVDPRLRTRIEAFCEQLSQPR